MWGYQFFISTSITSPLANPSGNMHNTLEKWSVCGSLIKFLQKCCRHQTSLVTLNNDNLQSLILCVFSRMKIKQQMNQKKQRPIIKQSLHQSNKVSNKLFMSFQRLSGHSIYILYRIVNKTVVLPSALPGALIFYLSKKWRSLNCHWPQANDLLQV